MKILSNKEWYKLVRLMEGYQQDENKKDILDISRRLHLLEHPECLKLLDRVKLVIAFDGDSYSEKNNDYTIVGYCEGSAIMFDLLKKDGTRIKAAAFQLEKL